MRFFPENLTFLGVPGGGSVLMTGIPVIKEEQALHCAQVIFDCIDLVAQCNGNRFLHAISRNLGVKTGQNTCPGTPPYRPIYAYIRGLGSKKIVSKE